MDGGIVDGGVVTDRTVVSWTFLDIRGVATDRTVVKWTWLLSLRPPPAAAAATGGGTAAAAATGGDGRSSSPRQSRSGSSLHPTTLCSRLLSRPLRAAADGGPEEDGGAEGAGEEA